MTDERPTKVPVVMRSRLGELDGCWLHVWCQCGRSSTIPLRLMMQQHGTGQYIGTVVPKLKCRMCGQKPYEATLQERGDTGAFGGIQGSWSVPLLPLKVGGVPCPTSGAAS